MSEEFDVGADLAGRRNDTRFFFCILFGWGWAMTRAGLSILGSGKDSDLLGACDLDWAGGRDVADSENVLRAFRNASCLADDRDLILWYSFWRLNACWLSRICVVSLARASCDCLCIILVFFVSIAILLLEMFNLATAGGSERSIFWVSLSFAETSLELAMEGSEACLVAVDATHSSEDCVVSCDAEWETSFRWSFVLGATALIGRLSCLLSSFLRWVGVETERDLKKLIDLILFILLYFTLLKMIRLWLG